MAKKWLLLELKNQNYSTLFLNFDMKKYLWAITILIIFVNAYFLFFTEYWIYGEYINLAAAIVMVWLGVTDISKNKDFKS